MIIFVGTDLILFVGPDKQTWNVSFHDQICWGCMKSKDNRILSKMQTNVIKPVTQENKNIYQQNIRRLILESFLVLLVLRN